MKVGELIARLQELDPNAEVLVQQYLYTDDDGNAVYGFHSVNEAIEGVSDASVMDWDISFVIEKARLTSNCELIPSVYLHGVSDEVST